MKPKENLISLLQTCAETSPDQILYIHEGKEYTARHMWESVCRLHASFVPLDIQPGSRVLLMLPNIPEYVISYFAILSSGAIVVPVNVMLREFEVRYMLEDSEACAIIADESSAAEVIASARNIPTLRHIIIHGDSFPPGTLKLSDLIANEEVKEPAEGLDSSSTGVILYTSGHTGRPKGAELTHYSLLRNAAAAVNLLQIRAKDCLAGVLPFTHAFGQTPVMNSALTACATVVLIPEFDPESVLKVVHDYRITLFLGTPSIYSLLLSYTKQHDYDFSSVRYCVSGGSALKPELLIAFEKEFSTTILEGYGLTETTAVSTFNHLHRERRPGSIGTPLESVEIKLVDDEGQEVPVGEVGEITIKTEYLMKGYLHRPEATRQVIKEGWFSTGDLARADEDGFLYIVDRKTDMIVKGGFNVYPAEVEKLLHAHPDVLQAAIIGVPDNIHGEEVKACIVLREGTNLTAEALGAYCRQHLARYKCPRYIQFFPKLPKSPSGYVLKKKLRETTPGNLRK